MLPRQIAGTLSLSSPTAVDVRVGPILPNIAIREGQVQLCAVLSSWPSVVIGVTNINPYHSCSRARGTDMNDPGSSSDLDITVTLGGQAGHPPQPALHCLHLFRSASLHRPWPIVSFIHHCIFAHPNRASVFSSRPWEKSRGRACGSLSSTILQALGVSILAWMDSSILSILAFGIQGIPQCHIIKNISLKKIVRRERSGDWLPLYRQEAARNWAKFRVYIEFLMGRVWNFSQWSDPEWWDF